MNNRKQQIYSFLNSITSKELENYIKDNKIHNKNVQELMDKIKSSKSKTHQDKIFNDINEGFGKHLSSYYKSGQAWVIAFVLECFYNDKYKISDLQEYLKAMMNSDKEVKEYVYEIMKDF
jgi:predicted DNA-binding ArsR family transcriptional regulator